MKRTSLPIDKEDPLFFCDDSIRSRIRIAATSDVPVLLLGARGTDKSRIARLIHKRSSRMLFPFHRFDCSLYSHPDQDRLLFGESVSGENRSEPLPGRFRQTWGGTLFLENVDLLSDDLKNKVLPYLHLGANNDLRFILSLSQTQCSSLSEDLSPFEHQIFSWPIRIPSLVERPNDLPVLIDRYIVQNADILAFPVLYPSEEQYQILCNFNWPGNHEQLDRILYRALLLGNGERLALQEAMLEEISETEELKNSPIIPKENRIKETESNPFPTLDDAMREHIQKALEKSHGRIDGEQGAAQLLAIHPNTLRARMHKLGLL